MSHGLALQPSDGSGNGGLAAPDKPCTTVPARVGGGGPALQQQRRGSCTFFGAHSPERHPLTSPTDRQRVSRFGAPARMHKASHRQPCCSGFCAGHAACSNQQFSDTCRGASFCASCLGRLASRPCIQAAILLSLQLYVFFCWQLGTLLWHS